MSAQSGGYRFGYSVAVDGDVLAVGAPTAVGNQGKAFILYDFAGVDTFEALTFSCEHDFKKFPDGDCGRSVDVSGNRVAVGMPHWPNSQLDDRGAVRIFERAGGQWVQWPRLEGTILGGYFGESVAIEGSTLAIGTPLGGVNGSASSIRTYNPTGVPGNGHWALQQALTPAGQDDDNWAWNLDASVAALAAGTTSAAYIFRATQGGYRTPQRIALTGTAKADVALDGDWLVVGNHDEGGSPPGAVHVYRWNGSTYVPDQVLTPPDGDHELFGWSVSISGDTIVVGDPRDHGEAPYAGAVHRYVRSGSKWVFTDSITAFDASAEDLFGWDVAVSHDWIVIGSPWDDDGGTDAGAIYVYDNSGTPPPPPPPPPGDAMCDGLPATISGTDGDDVLIGTGGFDIISGLGGNDTISGLGGDDLICGGPGNDLIAGGPGADMIFGGGGNDVIDGNAGDDIVFGGGGDDKLSGNSGSDIVKGNRGADKLFGNGGSDSLYGGTGPDVFVDGGGDDFMWGGKGADLVTYARSGAAVAVDLDLGIVLVGSSMDHISSISKVKGSRLGDELKGDANANVLRGGGGNDTLYGRGGSDVLKGGGGNDVAYGGKGLDRCVAERERGCET